MQDDDVGSAEVVGCQIESIRSMPKNDRQSGSVPVLRFKAAVQSLQFKSYDAGVRTFVTVVKSEKAKSIGNRLSRKIRQLESLDVFCLPALGPLGHVELHCLSLLQALETARLDRREMHKNVFAILTADEAVAFGVVEPLYCSLFCHVDTSFLFN